MATTDITTLARAKAALQIGAADTSRDTALQRYLTGLTQAFDRRYGPVVSRSLTETHDDPGPTIRLRAIPTLAIASVTVDGVATTDWLAGQWPAISGPELGDGRIWRTDGGWWSGRCVVVYSAGRYLTTAAAQDSVSEHAFLTLLAHQWADRTLGVGQAGAFDVPVPSYPASWPKVVDEIMRPEMVAPIGVG